jgi:hypothetical protein
MVEYTSLIGIYTVGLHGWTSVKLNFLRKEKKGIQDAKAQ